MRPLLSAIAYVSTSSKVLADDEIEALLARAREFNLEAKVTGTLLLNDRTFFQYFEGPIDSVHKVYDRIRTSRLHTGITELLNQTIQQRIFSSWFMGFAETPRSSILRTEQSRWSTEVTAKVRIQNPPNELGLVLDYCHNVRGRLTG